MPGNSKFQHEATDANTTNIAPETRPGKPGSDDCDDGSYPVQGFVPPPPRELIEVEFTQDTKSGVKGWDFDNDIETQGNKISDQTQGKKFSDHWEPGLKEILQNHNLESWRPSFPLQYPWSRRCSKESARDAYFKDGRGRFVTFKFSPEADVLSIAKELNELPEVDQAVAVPHITAPSPPVSEPFTGTSDQVVPICGPTQCLSNQWYLFRCEVPQAWNQSASGNGVVIADIDWGFDLSHPDLSHTEIRKNISRDSSNVSDGNLIWHGNGVLGLAGAAVNAEGMAGIAFGATLWAIQAGTAAINRPVVNHEFWVGAINFVRTTPARGRKVIILELQSAGFSNPEMIPSIRQEISLAINDQIVVCVPAGNGNPSEDAGLDDSGDPIPETDSIVVGATIFHPAKNLRGGSNGGDRVTVYAPGDHESDLTCGLRQGYRDHFGGTSGATAKVAGVVALMLEKNDQLTPQAVRDILKRSQKPVVDEDDNRVGVLVDANQAVNAAIALRSAAAGVLQAA